MDLDCDGVLEPHEVESKMDRASAKKYMKLFDINGKIMFVKYPFDLGQI